MEPVRFDCDCDVVVEMEEMNIGVEEVLQYARAIFTREELVNLIRGLEEIIQKATVEP
jgi:hypothetical protein